MEFECEACGKLGKFRCTACKAEHYCGRECQASFNFLHRPWCQKIKLALSKIAKEEKKLLSLPENVFETGVGRFWDIWETREYMRARGAHFFILKELGTKSSLFEGLMQGKDILRLCRSDDMNLRVKMTSMFLRLQTCKGTQECYDFVKWWKTCDPNGHYDWSDMSLPYLNIANADMFEPIYSGLLLKDEPKRSPFQGLMLGMGEPDVNSCIAVTLIKLRLFLQLRDFHRGCNLLLLGTLRQSSPVHLLRGDQGVLSVLLEFLRPQYACFKSHSLPQLRVLEKRLYGQVQVLLEHVETKMNNRIWKAFVNPAKIYQSRLAEKIVQGSAEEAINEVKSFLPLFYPLNGESTSESRGLREVLMERVGEKPEYDLSPYKAPPNTVFLQKPM